MKECTKCGEVKPLAQFYARKNAKDGRRADCKSCVNARAKIYSEKNRDTTLAYKREYREINGAELREKQRVYSKTERGREAVSRSATESRKRYPEKYKARSAVGHAIRDGLLERQPCGICGCSTVDAHHDDYSKPLDVRWLCRTHHAEHHKQERSAVA